MATIPLPDDFSECLKLLNKHRVRYLLVGGYAVAYHGYVRATADMDIWIDRLADNAELTVAALTDFGFATEDLAPEIFLVPDRVVRMGLPPFRIEILTSVSGLEFDDVYPDREIELWGDVEIAILDLQNLKINKRAAGRHQDLDDLDNLP